MKTQPMHKRPRCDLSLLSGVQLDARHAGLLEAAKASCGGSTLWRHRKLAEALDLCRLAQISNRLVIAGLDLAVDLRADLLMRVTVPCLPDPAGPLKVADAARLGIVDQMNPIVRGTLGCGRHDNRNLGALDAQSTARGALRDCIRRHMAHARNAIEWKRIASPRD